MDNPNPSVWINLKPNKPQVFSGARNFLIVNTWLYKGERYFNMVQLANANVQLSDANRISYATALLTGTAAIWWYTILKANSSPQTWDDFVVAIRKEFVPGYHERRARDALRLCKETGSVADYLSCVCNIVLTIPDMISTAKWDKIVSGLKNKIEFEDRKTNFQDFEEATKTAMRVGAAFSGISLESSASTVTSPAAGTPSPIPTEIGNTHVSNSMRGKQLLKDIRHNACFPCYKEFCRPWRHHKKGNEAQIFVSNIELALVSEEHDKNVDSDSSEN